MGGVNNMADFETIPAKDLDKYVVSNNSYTIDLRSKENYEYEHIKGAINIPYEELGKSLEVPSGLDLILYCERGSTSLRAARELSRKGYRVKAVVGGLHAYRGNNIEYGLKLLK